MKDTDQIEVVVGLNLEAFKTLMKESEALRDEKDIVTLKQLLESEMNGDPETFAEMLGWSNF